MTMAAPSARENSGFFGSMFQAPLETMSQMPVLHPWTSSSPAPRSYEQPAPRIMQLPENYYQSRRQAVPGPNMSSEELLSRGRVVFERPVSKDEMMQAGSLWEAPPDQSRTTVIKATPIEVPPSMDNLHHHQQQQQMMQRHEAIGPVPDVPWDMAEFSTISEQRVAMLINQPEPYVPAAPVESYTAPPNFALGPLPMRQSANSAFSMPLLTPPMSATNAVPSYGSGSINRGDDVNLNSPFAQTLMGYFRQYDRDGSGLISASELRATIARLGEQPDDHMIQGMIVTMDKSGDGMVVYSEFVKAWIRHDPYAHRLGDAFKASDADFDGYISISELRQTMKLLNKHPTDAEIEGMMRSADLDGDGLISYAEFVKMWIDCRAAGL